jgi:hypothetical protein
MALEDTFEHEGFEITFLVHPNGREAVARFTGTDGQPHEVVLRRAHDGGGSVGKVAPEALAAITALGLHIWPRKALATSKPQRGW